MNKTKQSIKGTLLSTIFLVIQMIFSFWRTKLIITVYGTDINSISQASNQIYAYLSLLESGLCAAYQYKMYKPYVEQKYATLNVLYKKLSKAMHRVGIRMAILVVLISSIYPLILAENSLNWIRSGVIFLLIGIRCVLPYWMIVAKKNILILEEKQYLVSSVDSLVNTLIIIVEVIFVKVFGFPIEITLVGGCVVILFSYIFYKNYVKKFWIAHPINESDDIPEELIKEADQMTKDIIVHQICGLANTNVDIMILSVINIFYVTVYANYNSIINYPVSIINNGIKNIRATIGLKFAAGTTDSYSVFREMLSFNMWCAGIVSAVFFAMINDFITVWLGKKYTLDIVCVLLFTLILFRRLISETIYSVRDANGLYKESKHYTLATAILNILLSLLCVRTLGIKGLLFGTVISNYFVMDYGNNKLVFLHVFGKRMYIYRDMIFMLLAVVLIGFFSVSIFPLLVTSWLDFLIKTVVMTFISVVIVSIILWIGDEYTCIFVKRLCKIREKDK